MNHVLRRRLAALTLAAGLPGGGALLAANTAFLASTADGGMPSGGPVPTIIKDPVLTLKPQPPLTIGPVITLQTIPPHRITLPPLETIPIPIPDPGPIRQF